MTEPTDAEIESAWIEATGSSILPYPDDMLAFARAVLAKWGTPPAVAGDRTVSHKAQAIPGVQWQCGPQANGFTSPKADSQPAPWVDSPLARRFGGCPSCGRSDCVAMSCTRADPADLLHIAARSQQEGK